MQPNNYNYLLARQINETLGGTPNLTQPLQALLQQISDTYSKYDNEYRTSEAKVKLRTDQLIASTSRAYSFLDSLHMGFIMCDVSAEVVVTNQSVRHILSQKMIGTSDKPVTVDNTIEWTISSIDGLLKPELQLKNLVLKSLSTNELIESKETTYGKRVLHLFIAPMVNDLSTGEKQQIGSVILIEDITEEKVLERSKDEFLSIASHELRTPLTAIRGNASLIKQYYGDKLPDKDVNEMIEDIHESSVRLIDIVNDFLDASSLEQGKMRLNPEEFKIGDVAHEVIRELNSLADAKGIKLICDNSVETVPTVKADKQRIKQVIYNLIGNGIKFTDTGDVTVSATSDGKIVYTKVTDTGKGMPPENQQLLFRKFQQAGGSLLSRDDTKGTGLGLYISKLIVEQSGGTISLEKSELGKGSSFVFSLPIV